MSFTEPRYYIWKNKFDNKQISELVNFCQNNYEDIEKHNPEGTIKDRKKAKSLIIGIPKLLRFPYFATFVSNIYYTNKVQFGFNLFHFENDGALLNIYDSTEKGKYDWHIDDSASHIFDSKLSVIINLSEKFTGGDFEINTGVPETIKDFSKPGTALMFRSNTLHRVLPVKSGVRKTLTLFLSGPRLI